MIRRDQHLGENREAELQPALARLREGGMIVLQHDNRYTVEVVALPLSMLAAIRGL